MGDRAEKANKSQFQRCLILLLIDAYSLGLSKRRVLFMFVCSRSILLKYSLYVNFISEEQNCKTLSSSQWCTHAGVFRWKCTEVSEMHLINKMGG